VLDIIDGNLKLILGMIWTLVLRFTIADIKSVINPIYIEGSYLCLRTWPNFLFLKAKKVCLPRKVFYYGVSVRLLRTKRSMYRISL